MSSAVLASKASSTRRYSESYALSSSCMRMMVSSRSLSRAVRAIMMSRCLSSTALYRPTCALPSSASCRSASSSRILPSYSALTRSCSSLSTALNSSLSRSGATPPPPRSCDCISLIRCSSSLRSFFSLRNSLLRCSSSVMARILSASAFRLCSSIWRSALLSTRFFVRSSSSCLSRFSSRSYFRRRDFWSRSSLIRAVFLMCLARLANLSVESDSVKDSSAGEIIAIIVVLQLPPRESSRMRVSFESRYGMCGRPFGSVKALMTLPSALSDWLIFFDSSSLVPVAPDSRTRSLPARSTRLSLPTLNDCRSSVWPASSVSLEFSTMIMKTACDREESSFIRVAPVVRCDAPLSINP
mmetsp:Transcript_4463/g.20026  ORF Transcript_4463/g.20026 Transcript_4463/m.20026 type:complete len:356 (+) Transcript_4463:662-1729(+)